ncbi:MAG: lmo0937 family membrane protein [Chloroflexota bacterium]|nr:lmo0937 family membrane protein [Chloroflexota bacterium]
MLWALAVILVIMWILGLSVNVGGGLIHLLIVLAVIVLLYNLFVGRRSSGL